MGGNAEGRAVDEQKFGEPVEGGTLSRLAEFPTSFRWKMDWFLPLMVPYLPSISSLEKHQRYKNTAPKQALEKLECFLLKRDAPKTTTASSNL